MENLEIVCFQIISNVGTAKSCYLEALKEAKLGNFEIVEKKIAEGDRSFISGHKVHGQLIQKEAAGDNVNFSLLLVHAEDQLIRVEVIKIMVLELIEIYQSK